MRFLRRDPGQQPALAQPVRHGQYAHSGEDGAAESRPVVSFSRNLGKTFTPASTPHRRKKVARGNEALSDCCEAIAGTLFHLTLSLDTFA